MSRIKNFTVTAAITFSFLNASFAENTWDLQIGGGSNWSASEQQALSGSDAAGQFGLSAARTLPHLKLFGFTGEATIDWSLGSMGETSFDVLSTQLTTQTFGAGIRGRRDLTERISVFAGGKLLASHGSLTLDSGYSESPSIKDGDWAFGSALSLGSDIGFVERSISNVIIGLRAEVGLQAMSSYSFRAKPAERTDNQITIPTHAAALGSVNMSGPFLRFGLFGRF